MSQRLPSLLNSTVKSNIRHNTLRQRATTLRSYATHQEQDAKPTSSSTPLIVGGLLVLGGLIYYTKGRDPSKTKKSPDPSDVTFQTLQKEADQFIEGRHDASGAINVQDQPASTIMNENSNLTAHPMTTKKEAYVDPRTLAKQTGHATPPPPYDGPHNSQQSISKEAAKLATLPTLSGGKRQDLGGADAGGHGAAAAIQTRDTATSDEPISVSLSRVPADLKEGAQEKWTHVKKGVDEQQQRIQYAMDQTVQSVEGGAQDIKNKAESEWEYITNKTAEDARSAQRSAESAVDSVHQSALDAKDRVQSTLDRASATASEKAKEAEQAVHDTNDQVKGELNRWSTDASNKAEGVKSDVNAKWNRLSTDASNKAEAVKDQARDDWNELSADARSKLEKETGDAKSNWDIFSNKAGDKVDEAKDQVKDAYEGVQSEFNRAEHNARQRARDVKESMQR